MPVEKHINREERSKTKQGNLRMHKDEIHHYALTGFIRAMPSAFPSFVQDAASVSCSESQLTVS